MVLKAQKRAPRSRANSVNSKNDAVPSSNKKVASSPSTRTRSVSASRSTTRSNSFLKVISGGGGGGTSPSTTNKKSVSTSSSNRKSSSSNQSTRKSASGDVVVVNNNNGRAPLRRSTSTISAASSSSDKAPVASKAAPPAKTSTTTSKPIKSPSTKAKSKVTSSSSPSANKKNDISYVPPAVQDKEVDFFSNPTILSRLIQNQKFTAAISRLEKQGPVEASIWVCTKRKLPAALQFADRKNAGSSVSSRSSASGASAGGRPGDKNNGKDDGSSSEPQYTFRQLPIHMACGSLFRVEDQTLREDLENLIARLVIAFPDGCARRDHQGRYPLHECIWYNAAPPIISALLMAAPDIARIADMQGVTPAVLNEHRQCPDPAHKKMVRSMLKKSPEFWQTARKEAELRMKHREIPGSDATITSTSVLASSVMDEETIVSREKQKKQQLQQLQQQKMMQQQKQQKELSQRQRQEQEQREQLLLEVRLQQAEPQPAPAKPLEWTQLEKRAAALEQKLSESFEHIYVLNQQMNELRGAKNALQAKVDKFANSDLGKRVITLEHEKDELQFHLARSQALLAKHGISLEEENIAEGMPPLPPLQISFESTPTEETATNTTDEDNEKVEEVVEDDEDGVNLSMEQQKLALLKEQLNMLNQDHQEYQERLQDQYYCEIVPDDQTAKSEITTDDFTTMTPASKFYPARPEPDANASLIGGPRMAPVMEEQLISGSVSESTKSSREKMPNPEYSVVPTPEGPVPSLPPNPEPPLVPTSEASVQSSLLGEQSELDSVLMGAMQLNGGQGLSPDLVALWRSTSVGGTGAGPSAQSIAGYSALGSAGPGMEGNSVPTAEEMEQMGKRNVRPGADDSSLVSPPSGAPQWRSPSY